MKKYILAIFLFYSVQALYAQSYETIKDYKAGKICRGFITDSLLKADTAFSKWYNDAQKVYTPKDAVVKALAATKDSVHFVVFMGTWCSDSHFIIPRFYKIIETAGYDKNKITLLALDRTKKDTTHLAAALHISQVPTIIIYKNGKEAGRVVEYGSTGKYDDELAALLRAAK